MRNFVVTLVCICSLGLTSSQAQYWEIGGWGGISFYNGDIAPTFTFQRPGPAGGFFVRRNIDRRLAIRGGLMITNIGASDHRSSNAFRKARNLSFQSNIFEGSVLLEFNFLPYHFTMKKSGFTPYLAAGFTVFHFNPKAKYKDGGWYPLQPLGTEGQAPGQEYALIQPGIFLGGGFKIDVTRRVTIQIEVSTRFLFTDYLDDVSGTYANIRLIEGYRGSLSGVAASLSDRSPEVGERIGQEGRQRGDTHSKDSYMNIGIGINYSFLNIRCPAY
ncbi:MAG: PorT family protein [Aureispira sp.]|nr:PorT family protein [Aureispira sp.]